VGSLIHTKTIVSGWSVVAYKHHIDLFFPTSDEILQLITTTSESFCVQKVVKCVPLLLAIVPEERKIYTYSNRLSWELFLSSVDKSSQELDSHLAKILSIDVKTMPSDILTETHIEELPDFFGDIFWRNMSEDAYVMVESFIKKLSKYRPSIFERITNFKLGLIAKHDSLRIHMLKFLSVLPSLDFDESGQMVVDSLVECMDMCIDDKKLPMYLRLGMKFDKFLLKKLNPKLSTCLIRYIVRKLATRFVVDEKNSRNSLKKLFDSNRDVTLDRLGELVLSEHEADLYCDRVITMIQDISSVVPRGERNVAGILKSHVSIKISALCSEFRPHAFEHTFERVAPRLRKIFESAIDNKTFVHVDAEHYHYRDCVFEIFKKVLSEYPEWEDVGIVVQCYLKDSDIHLAQVTDFARSRKIIMPIRLVKGAYWDAETIETSAHGHSSYQFLNKEETDIRFRQLVGYSFDNRDALQVCIGSHNYVDHIFAETLWKWQYKSARRPEHQCLHMTYEALSVTMADGGWAVRDYLPVGDLIDGMAYLVRRIMENSSQKGVLSMMRSHKDKKMMIPPTDLHTERMTTNRITRDLTLEFTSDFFNVPPIRLFLENERTWVNDALNDVEVGDVELTSEDELKQMVDDVQHGHTHWISERMPSERAVILVNAAQRMLIRRLEFAVVICKETNKTIDEALADVDEAIDFLNFYAREEVKLPRLHAKCPFVVIAPWNFPLAIPCGMTAGPLVAGNAVILKSSSKSHYVAELFVDLMHESGVPENVLIHVKGGGELADKLLDDERIRGCVFTGSTKVGSHILKKVGRRIGEVDGMRFTGKVIAETGGKNAIVVTATADMDEAVEGTLKSAFSHAGQKCSACSRVIVDNRIKEKFIGRLKRAVDSIVVGDALDYSTFVNPVVDDAETKRLLDQQWNLRADIHFHGGKLVCYDSEPWRKDMIPKNVSPMVVEIPTEVALRGEVMFEKELFGPILHIVGYDDEKTALTLFNQTQYGLTGGIFSQSQNEIDRLTDKFECGNIYVNRTITGARVEIEPFGGFKMSGTGPKAGGNTYLGSFHMDRERDTNPLKLTSEIRSIPGQKGYITRLDNRNVCFVCKGGMSWFGYDCMKSLSDANIEFDAVALDEISEEDLGDVSGNHDIHNMTILGRGGASMSPNYDVYVIGNQIDEGVVRYIYNNIPSDKKFPIVMSKYDCFLEDTFSDSFMSTRTHVVNTMRHGAELS